MARRRREEEPAASNRGRPGARGVLLIFERERKPDEQPRDPAANRPEDEPLARDEGDGDGDAAA